MSVKIPRYSISLFLVFSALAGQTSFLGLESWHHAQTLVLSGGGEMLITGVSEFRNPALLTDLSPRFRVSMVRYPAGIGAESIVVNGRKGKHFFGLNFRHLGYGVFQGRDEYNQSTGEYTSGDAHLTFSYARASVSGRLSWGYTSGFFISNLEKSRAIVFTFSPGIVVRLQKEWGRIGLRIENLGRVLDAYTNTKETLPSLVKVSYGKRLVYLPLELGLDLGFPFGEDEYTIGVGGIFHLPHGLQLKWGSASRRKKQVTAISIVKDILADTGLGLAYVNNGLSVETGIYFYGPGGSVVTAGLGVTY